MQIKHVTPQFLVSILTILLSFSASSAKKILSLSDIQAVVISNNNEIKAIESEVKASKSLILQAGLRQNPELEFGIETGIGGEEAVTFNKFEIGVGQTFELGDKKEARIAVAKNNVSLIELEFNRIKRELESETLRRVIPIASLKDKLTLIDEIIVMSKNINAVIQKRVNSGAAMEIDLFTSQIELDNLTIDREEIVREIATAKKNLIAVMGEKPIVFDDISTSLSNNYTLPKFAELEILLHKHNDFSINEMQQKVLTAELADIKANAVSDLSIGIGYERNLEEGANGVSIGFGIGLPFFNKNQGEIAEKKETIVSIKHQSDNIYQQLKLELVDQYNSLVNIDKKISSIKKRTLPKIEELYVKVRELYEKSAVPIFHVIETEIKLVETKMSIIELKGELAEISANIFEITGYKGTIVEN